MVARRIFYSAVIGSLMFVLLSMLACTSPVTSAPPSDTDVTVDTEVPPDTDVPEDTDVDTDVVEPKRPQGPSSPDQTLVIVTNDTEGGAVYLWEAGAAAPEVVLRTEAILWVRPGDGHLLNLALTDSALVYDPVLGTSREVPMPEGYWPAVSCDGYVWASGAALAAIAPDGTVVHVAEASDYWGTGFGPMASLDGHVYVTFSPYAERLPPVHIYRAACNGDGFVQIEDPDLPYFGSELHVSGSMLVLVADEYGIRGVVQRIDPTTGDNERIWYSTQAGASGWIGRHDGFQFFWAWAWFKSDTDGWGVDPATGFDNAISLDADVQPRRGGALFTDRFGVPTQLWFREEFGSLAAVDLTRDLGRITASKVSRFDLGTVEWIAEMPTR